jgi:hypothetical protein
MNTSNVALKALLAHIAAGIADEYVQQTKAANASSEVVAGEQKERGA